MNLYAIQRRVYWESVEALERSAARSAEVGAAMDGEVRWIRTYVVREADGMVGTVCIYEGTSAEKVREHAERSGVRAHGGAVVADLVVIGPDSLDSAA